MYKFILTNNSGFVNRFPLFFLKKGGGFFVCLSPIYIIYNIYGFASVGTRPLLNLIDDKTRVFFKSLSFYRRA